jgi:hypothetical protein
VGIRRVGGCSPFFNGATKSAGRLRFEVISFTAQDDSADRCAYNRDRELGLTAAATGT